MKYSLHIKSCLVNLVVCGGISCVLVTIQSVGLQSRLDPVRKTPMHDLNKKLLQNIKL